MDFSKWNAVLAPLSSGVSPKNGVDNILRLNGVKTFQPETFSSSSTVPSSPGKNNLGTPDCVCAAPLSSVRKSLETSMTPRRDVRAGGQIVCFRPMRSSDYPSVRNLIPSVSTCETSFDPYELQAFLSIPTFHPVVAVDQSDDRTLLGYAELYRLPHIGRGFDGRLERVVVDPSMRSKGLGTQLCDYVVDQARRLGCGRVDLTVEKEDARHIYEDKFQFQAVSTTVMRKKFPFSRM